MNTQTLINVLFFVWLNVHDPVYWLLTERWHILKPKAPREHRLRDLEARVAALEGRP